MKRVVRVHCIFDTNAKMQIKRDQELAFGSRDLDVQSCEQRIIVFECQDYVHSAKTMLSYDQEIVSNPWFRELMEEVSIKGLKNDTWDRDGMDSGMDIATPNLLKKHTKSLSKKK